MEDTQILEKLTPIFRKVFNDEDILVDMNLTSDNIDEWSSITQMLMVAEVEKEFGITFKLFDVATMNSAKEIVAKIKSKLV